MMHLELGNVFAGAIGAAHGLDEAEFAAALRAAGGIPGEVDRERRAGTAHGYLNVPLDAALAPAVLAVRDAMPARHFVVAGIGGSALGSAMLRDALALGAGAAVHVLDNLDPDILAPLFERLPPRETVFNVITKSGDTTETLAQCMIILGRLRDALPGEWKRHLVVTTGENPLRDWAKAEGIACLPVPPPVGGRFSVLTAVGLLSAAYAGIDIAALLAGAAEYDRRVADAMPEENAALQFALAMQLLNTQKAKSQVVMMPYSSRLFGVADWFRQLWAESLGKRVPQGGGFRCVGQTPIKALGATDQHSQIQLYVEGPPDKVVVFLRVEQFEHACIVPRDVLPEFRGLDYLRGRDIGDILNAEQMGTQVALVKAGRPSAVIGMARVTPEAVGGLLHCLALATTYSGKLYRINAYDQPGVEEGKRSTYALLNRAGYESQKQALLPYLAKDKVRDVPIL